MRTIILTPAQRYAIDRAAQTLLPSMRDNFLDNVARWLGSEPSDVAVQIAIDMELAVNRIPAFCCGSK